MNGRDYNQLALLSPGVLPGTPRLASVNFKGVFNVNGNRTFNNVFQLDGVDNISYSNTFRGENVQLVQPSMEALQEFKIQTNAYSAEYGRSSGAVVNATIKSGTNTLRGSVYEFLRNDRLDANNFFSNALGAPKPKRERNQFGVAAGGPIVRNRTFWFADYEGLRIKKVSRACARCQQQRKRRACSAAQSSSVRGGAPRVQPQRQRTVGHSPRTLGSCRRGYRRIDSGPECRRIHDLRVDAGDRHQAGSVRRPTGSSALQCGDDLRTLQFRRYPHVPPAPLLGLAEGSFNDAFGDNDNRSQGLALGLTWTLSPNLVGDFRFGYSRGDYYTYPPNFGVDGPAEIGLRNVPNDPAIVGGVPKVNIQGFDAVGRHTSTPQFQTPRSWNPRATISLNRGAHFIKFGAEFLRVETRINDLNATIGRMNFENRFTNRAVGDLLLGCPHNWH